MALQFKRLLGQLGFVAVAAFAAQSASAGFVDYVIRNATASGDAPVINTSGGQTEFLITQAGQKAALGSNDINGMTLGSITSLKIDRLDDVSSYQPGSGPAFAPYLNFWITDGLGHFAVVANEPTDSNFQALYNNGYDLDFADLSNKVAKIFETSDTSWLPNSGLNLKFSDLANFKIVAPDTTTLSGLSSGAPDDILTNAAYGFNWVFGDTLSNYVATAGRTGYLVANASVAAATAVPEPGTVVLFGAGLLALMVVRRRRDA